jgi:hypothetical protein
VVPLRDGASVIEVRGTLDWLPPPNAAAWWAFALLGAVAVGALGLLPRRNVTGALAALAAVGGLTAVILAVTGAMDAGATGVGATLQALLVGHLWPVLTGLGALAVAGYTLAGRPAADFAVAVSGACLAMVAVPATSRCSARRFRRSPCRRHGRGWRWPPSSPAVRDSRSRARSEARSAEARSAAARSAAARSAAARSAVAEAPAVPLPEPAESS